MNIAVFGLGYVGSVTSACLASLGHRVTGVDISEHKVADIKAGRSPIVERDLSGLIEENVAARRLTATTDATAGVKDADLILVCVGTPSRDDGSLDLAHAVHAAAQVGKALAAHPHPAVVVFRSTMLPGSVESVLVPAIEAASRLTWGKDFGVCYNPEFLREGTAVADFFEAPYTILGVREEREAEPVAALYKKLPGDLHTVDLRTAEMLKYVNNCFHALKVAFANEVGRLCQRESIDSHEVMRLMCMDTKLNLSPYYLRPGFAFGGSCLPKDLRAITHRARERNLDLPVFNAVLRSNDIHVQAAVAAVERQRRKKVGVLGLSFKAETDDLRESPIVRVVGTLVGKGYELLLHDNHVNVARLVGANRDFLEREIPYLERLFRTDAREVVRSSEVIVIANSHPTYREVPGWLNGDQVVVDFVRLLEPKQVPGGHYVGLAW
ncbi:MAG TPA: nucleotide sugar dehydrogenase [Candidatus Eisenbacteria bacterium]|nr:nucleotide sugar dehydrogenase [Candidatus Eisenbacteria bacterium]